MKNGGVIVMRKSTITEDKKKKWWNGILFEKDDFDCLDDFIKLAIEKAYRDLQRTMRGFPKSGESKKNEGKKQEVALRDEIKKNARKCISAKIKNMIDCNITEQTTFDKLHEDACEALIEEFKKNEYEGFTIGQAQKWINMTFKYLNLLDCNDIEKIYEFCHIPIDRYILEYMLGENIIGKENFEKVIPWSKIEKYQDYFKIQEKFRDNCKSKIPLDEEFEIWKDKKQKDIKK